MNSSYRKEERLTDLLIKLKRLLGQDAFDIVDHWDADTSAIGIASPHDHRVLVYISTCNLPLGQYYAALELPSETEDFPYQDAGQFYDVTFKELVQIISKHLRKQQ